MFRSFLGATSVAKVMYFSKSIDKMNQFIITCSAHTTRVFDLTDGQKPSLYY